MIEILDATQTDLDAVRQNPINETVKRYPVVELTGWAKAAFVDGECVGVGGVVVYWQGVGECWLQLSKEADNHKIELVRCIRRIIELAFEELKLYRLQATERADFPQTMRMAEHLGFKKEGLMLKYAPDGGDVWLYAIVKEG